MEIIDYLGKGQENAVHLDVLCKLTNYKESSVKKEIKRQRENGVPIVSSARGYWLAENQTEISTFCNYLKKTACARFKTRQGLINSIKE